MCDPERDYFDDDEDEENGPIEGCHRCHYANVREQRAQNAMPRILDAAGKPMKFVVAYRIDRVCGGPEEGGWWYTTGTEVETRALLMDDKDDAVVEAMSALYPHTGASGMFSRRDDDYTVRVIDDTEGHVPLSEFPFASPHYC